jgi:hypothetical protein
VHDDAPDKDVDPAGHFMHCADPVTFEYVPGKHIEHVDPASVE